MIAPVTSPTSVPASPTSKRLVAAGPVPVETQTLGARVAAAVSAPRWMWIAGGAVGGALLFGMPGAVIGAIAGAWFTR